jgi:serine/threonine protein kinase/WD40 repeat protein
MAPQTCCSRCGTALAADAPAGGVCPACLLNLGLDAETVRYPQGAVAGDDTYVGPYRLLKLLGEGGMGMVYLAEQVEPIHRTVALKLIKLGMDTRAVIGRFDSERQALAMMDHPNVAQIYDAGATPGGRPYFVMEYVPGIPISEFCREHRLELRQKLELLIQVAHGVQHAHEKGIIHRDLKPANVLVTLQDGRPIPKIIDFGLAKAIRKNLSEETFFTETGTFIGTPEYMSPEQAAMSEHVDTRTDIHSLGVLLYELLVGVRPFDSGDLRESRYLEILRVIREDDPPMPSARAHSLGGGALDRQLRGDLDWITVKALEKDPARRYASASELAADIERHLHDEPVIAGPATTLYRPQKFVRKNRIKVAAAVAVVACLVAGLCASTYLYFRAERRRAEAERQRLLTERQSYAGNLAAAELSLGLREPATAQLRLHACPPALRGWEWRQLFYDSDPSLAELTAGGKFRRHHYRHPSAPTFGFSADGATFYWHTGEAVGAWVDSSYRKAGDALTGFGEVLFATLLNTYGNSVAFTPDGKRVLAGSEGQTVRVWEVFHYDGNIWKHTGKRIVSMAAAARRVAAGFEDGTLETWDALSGETIASWQGHQAAVRAIAITVDGSLIVSASDDRTAQVWESGSHMPLAGFRRHTGAVLAIGFSPDGSRVVSGSEDGTARIWLAATGAEVAAATVGEPVSSIAFSPDGDAVVFGSGDPAQSAVRDPSVRLWRAASGAAPMSFGARSEFSGVRAAAFPSGSLAPPIPVAFSPDGRRVLAGFRTYDQIRIYPAGDAANILVTLNCEGGLISFLASPDGSRIVAGTSRGMLQIFDPENRESLLTLPVGEREPVEALLFTLAGNRLLALTSAGVRAWDSASPHAVVK